MLDRLREEDPHTFQDSAIYFRRDLICFAILEDRWGDLPDLLVPCTDEAALDGFVMVIAQLTYHGQLGPLIDAMKIAWPKIKESHRYAALAAEEFEGWLMEQMLVDYLENTAAPRADDPQLHDEAAFPFPWAAQLSGLFVPRAGQTRKEFNGSVSIAGGEPYEGERKTLTGLLRWVAERISLSRISRFLSRWPWSGDDVAAVW